MAISILYGSKFISGVSGIPVVSPEIFAAARERFFLHDFQEYVRSSMADLIWNFFFTIEFVSSANKNSIDRFFASFIFKNRGVVACMEVQPFFCSTNQVGKKTAG
ncbi:hypothetical protein D3C85_1172850 [compost metagenome]